MYFVLNANSALPIDAHCRTWCLYLKESSLEEASDNISIRCYILLTRSLTNPPLLCRILERDLGMDLVLGNFLLLLDLFLVNIMEWMEALEGEVVDEAMVN